LQASDFIRLANDKYVSFLTKSIYFTWAYAWNNRRVL